MKQETWLGRLLERLDFTNDLNLPSDGEDFDWIDQEIELLKRKAKKGHARAQYLLGDYYLRADINKNLRSEGADLILCAANQGYDEAQMYLANSYLEGRYFKKDGSEAVWWYRKAAENGDQIAQIELSRCYAFGIGGSQPNYQTATKWARKAYQPDDVLPSSMDLQLEHEEEELGTRKLLQWIRLSAETSDSEALLKLGCIHWEGLLGQRRNKEKAYYCLKEAANLENEDALIAFGNLLLQDLNNKEHCAQALFCFEMAAKQGNIEALYQLGNLYRFGIGIEQSPIRAIGSFNKEAFRWYLKAGHADHAEAQLELAALYLSMDSNDKLKALKWATLASMRKPAYQKYQAAIEDKLTSKQRQEAQSLTSSWLSKRLKVTAP